MNFTKLPTLPANFGTEQGVKSDCCTCWDRTREERVRTEKRESEGKRSPVLRSHISPATLDSPDLGSTKAQDWSPPFYSFPSAHPLVFRAICCCWRTPSEPFRALQEISRGGWGPVVVQKPPLVRCPGLAPSLAAGTLSLSLQADLQAQQWNESWLTTALPCLGRALPPPSNFPATAQQSECLRQPCLCAHAPPRAYSLCLLEKRDCGKVASFFTQD